MSPHTKADIERRHNKALAEALERLRAEHEISDAALRAAKSARGRYREALDCLAAERALADELVEALHALLRCADLTRPADWWRDRPVTLADAALRSLDGLNVQSQQARSHADRLNQSYAELERAVLDEAEELPE